MFKLKQEVWMLPNIFDLILEGPVQEVIIVLLVTRVV